MLRRLLLNTKKWPKIGTHSVKAFFLPKGQKSLGQRLKPSAGARSSGLYLLVALYRKAASWYNIFFFLFKKALAHPRSDLTPLLLRQFLSLFFAGPDQTAKQCLVGQAQAFSNVSYLHNEGLVFSILFITSISISSFAPMDKNKVHNI